MKFLQKAKDGGQESTVTGYWLIELKSLFSIVLLRFSSGSRDAYHSHAFDSANWVLSGCLIEKVLRFVPNSSIIYWPSLRPVITRRARYHKVISQGTTWVLSLRGPWTSTWREFSHGKETLLTDGRKVIMEIET
jgi:hypothetical protein